MKVIKNLIETANIYDLIHNTTSKTDNGWKLSIQGKCIDDVMFLYERLSDYLINNDIPFKVATSKRLKHTNREQASKVMTIYVVNGINHLELAETIYSMIMDYKGWYNTPTPTSYEHYAGGIFYRNDRDEYGNYITAN